MTRLRIFRFLSMIRDLQQTVSVEKEIVQTIDLPATVLEFFNVGLPKNMQGRPIRTVIEKDEKTGIMHYLEFTVRMLIFMMENIFI